VTDAALLIHALKYVISLSDDAQTIKVCAESQLDTPSERLAAVIVVGDLASNGSVPSDVESLELYEWACRDIQPWTSYPETLGVLRSRWVKANPRSPAVVSCLQACLQQWDLVNAQQVGLCSRRRNRWNRLADLMLDCCHPGQVLFAVGPTIYVLEHSSHVSTLRSLHGFLQVVNLGCTDVWSS